MSDTPLNKKTAGTNLESGFFFLIAVVLLVFASGVYYNNKISHSYYNATENYEKITSSQQILFSLINKINNLRNQTNDIYRSKNKNLKVLTVNSFKHLMTELQSLIILLDHIRKDQELPELQDFIQALYLENKSSASKIKPLMIELKKGNTINPYKVVGKFSDSLDRANKKLIKIHTLIASKIKAETLKQKTKASTIIQNQYIILIILPLILTGFALYGASISSQMKVEIKLQTKKLHYEKERAIHANNAKNEFITNMSHEFKTPIHSILSFAKLGLKNLELKPDNIEKYFDRIITSGGELFELVSTLLNIAQLELGNETLNIQAVDITSLLRKTNKRFKERYHKSDLHTELSISEQMPNIECDAEKIQMVVSNLIDNAIKYSPTKSYLVLDASVSNNKFLFTIDDTGPGIPESEMEHIFDKFTQSSFTKTGAGGTGLGLCISKEYILLHQGRIWAENLEQGGARFSFEIPLLSADDH